MENDILNYLWSPWIKAANFSWEQVLHLAVKKKFNKNDIIFENGQFVDKLYYLQEGEIKMIYLNSEGEEKPVWYIGSGNVFGEAPFFLQNQSSIIVTCVKDSIVYVFDREIIMEMILSHDSYIIIDLLTCMAGKIQTLTRQIYDLSLTSAKMRIYKLLYFMSITKSNSILDITQQDLADLLGIHRVTVNKVLVALKNDGIIEHDLKRKRITISQPASLLTLIEKEQNG